MRNKSLFLLLAGICGTVAAVGVGQWMQAQNGTATVDMTEILVTTVSINPEEQITAEKLRLEQWPTDRIPQGASADLGQFEGRFAKVPLYAGEPMLDLKLMNEVEDKVVPRGYTVVSLPAGRDGTVNLVSPGDRVDIRGFFTKGEMFARDMALDVLTGIKVYGIDGITKFDPDQPRTRSARDIQLLIRKADVEAFDFAKKLGEISLSLGSPTADDETIPEGEPSEAARNFLRDLQERRDEQERLRKLAEAEKPAEEEQTEAGPKKATFRTTKIINGRMIVYEWVEGEPLPRVVGDTGSLDPASSDDSVETTVEPNNPTSDDYLRGADSPFFQPDGGEGSEE
ncbi:Flp pilus assembly protein CpaB [Stieleria mannarensis]|uniref:Flp pilus assembly protein CpaB n=1 Tax=Stieleria mannarensis TaxID=2755585 RepID=UPI001600B015|nr:Flp pilus assembly protein CpaB [Rhodopirellula sp. JC639]